MLPRPSHPVDGAPQSRGLLLDHIAKNPGSYFSQLQRATGLAQGELAYHLQVLEAEERIVHLDGGHYKHYFLRNVFPAAHKTMLSVLTLPQPRDILLRICEQPGRTATDIARSLHTTPPNVAWHLKRLSAAGLVEKRRDGSSVRYFATADPVALRRFLEAYHPSVWQTWSARFAETWGKLSPG